jgi:superfamily II DNA or RNA helicase
VYQRRPPYDEEPELESAREPFCLDLNGTDAKVVILFTPYWCTLTFVGTHWGSDGGNTDSFNLEEALDSALSYHPDGYVFSPKYQSHVWDGMNHPYHTKTHRFRAGMLSRVCDFLTAACVPYEIANFPATQPFQQRSATYALRPYQRFAVSDIVSKRFGILQAPPRAGKTHLFIATVDSERHFPVIFFCRSLDLAYQTVSRVKQFLPDVSVGLVGDGQVDIKDVTVVTIQSAFSAWGVNVKKLKDPALKDTEKPLESSAEKEEVKSLVYRAKIVFYDECHHTKASTSRFILDKCVQAELRIGLSATPFSGASSDMTVEESIGPVIHSISYSELIREGFLLRPMIYMYRLPKMSLNKLPYPTVYKAAVTDNAFLTGLIVKIVHQLNSMGKSVVVQTDLISHTKILTEACGAVMLTGQEKDMDYRQKVIQDLNDKKILCVVSTLFEEGLDVPTLDYTINAAGGLSSISTFQRMRSITAVEGKDTCGIIDFYHDCAFLDRHSKTRKQLYMSEPEFVFEMRDVSKMALEEI